MRRLLITASAVVLIAGVRTAPAVGQTGNARALAAAIADVSDGAVQFRFTPREGVCGDGLQTISRGRPTRANQHYDCTEGPLVVELSRRAGTTTDVHLRVGGESKWSGRELGPVDAAAAATYLLDAATHSATRDDDAGRMIFAAALAPVETWPRLLDMARDRDLPARRRQDAMFWLSEEAGTRVTDGLVSIAGDDSEEVQLRTHAVFVLSRMKGDAIERLIGIARTNAEPEVRRQALFWLGRTGDPRAVAFFEEILKG